MQIATMNPGTACRGLKRIPFLALLFLLVGFLGVIVGHFPGDLGDARINCYFLEHFFRCVCGLENSFIQAPFFYPWPATIGFSDTHWGTAPIYVLFRAAGLSNINAYSAWFIVGNVLNFTMAYLVLCRLGLGQLGAGVGAFLFSFCIPASAQFEHSQLTYRYGVPLAVYFLHRYLTTRKALFASLALLFLALQVLATLYIGLFLGYLLLAWFLAWCYLKKVKEGQPITLTLKNLVPTLRRESSPLMSGGIAVLAIFLLILALSPYLEVSFLYAFERPWRVIKYMLPRPQSYFLADTSRLWACDPPAFPSLPTRGEHQLFFGLATVLAIAAAVFCHKCFQPNPVLFLMRTSFFLLVGLTLCVFDYTLYYFVARLPGFNAIRAVSRIILVLAFPAAFMLGAFVEGIYNRKNNVFIWRAIAVVLVIGCLVETVLIKPDIASMKDWQPRIDRIEVELNKTLKRQISRNDVLVLAQPRVIPSGYPYFNVREVDGMAVSQSLGIKTVNGYTGNQPDGWKGMTNGDDILDVVLSGKNFRKEHHLSDLDLNPDNFILVGFTDVDRAILSRGLKAPPPTISNGKSFSVGKNGREFLRYFLGSGWSGIGSEYVYSIGTKPTLLLDFESNGRKRLYLDIGALLPTAEFIQHVTVTANDVPVGEMTFTRDINRTQRYFDLPETVGKSVILKLSVAKPISPEEARIPADSIIKFGVVLFGLGRFDSPASSISIQVPGY